MLGGPCCYARGEFTRSRFVGFGYYSESSRLLHDQRHTRQTLEKLQRRGDGRRGDRNNIIAESAGRPISTSQFFRLALFIDRHP